MPETLKFLAKRKTDLFSPSFGFSETSKSEMGTEVLRMGIRVRVKGIAGTNAIVAQ